MKIRGNILCSKRTWRPALIIIIIIIVIIIIIIIIINNLILILRAFHEMIKRALHDFYL